MKECKCESGVEVNPFKAGEVVKSPFGYILLVIKVNDKLRLCDIEDGLLYDEDSFSGSLGYSDLEIVNVCYKVED